MYVYVCAYVCMRMYVCIYVCMCVCGCVMVCVYACVCMRMYVYNYYMCVSVCVGFFLFAVLGTLR